MREMKLYEQENDEIVYRTQLADPFFQQLTDIIFRNVPGVRSGRILDLGCGAGRNLFEAVKRGYQAVGVDDNKKSLRVAKLYLTEKGMIDQVTLIRDDIMALKKGELGKFDYVILQEVIEHVEDYQALIDFAYSSLKKGGKVLITTPHDPGQWNQFDDYARHVRRFKISQVRAALSGFSGISVYTFGFPVHRTVQAVYLFALGLRNKQHQAKSFRGNKLVHRLYNVIGSVVIKTDLLFRFLPLGTTVVAVGTK